MSVQPAWILVIEDDPAEIRLLRYVLDQHAEPYVLDVLRDGEEALRFVHQQRKLGAAAKPCVIILDLHLPKYDGLAVLEAIRTEPALSNVKVVVVTTAASEQDERRVLDLGVQLYREKPVGLADFEALGREILELCKDEAVSVAGESSGS